jgi:serine/threonine-protein kinase HipA
MSKLELSVNVRSGDVLFKDAAAGVLIETAGGGTRFTYSRDWKVSIACGLPVSRREHEWPQGLHPFFEHLGPEGWLRERQARVAHIAEEDDFGLLLRYGADCIGAVGIRSAEPLANVEPVAEAPANPGRTISGVQRKLLVVKKAGTFHPAEPTGLAPYIAKFNSENLPTLVRNEALSLRWTADVLGKSEVCEADLGHVPPATIFDSGLPIWRLGEALLHAARLAELLKKDESSTITVHFRALYTGLTGRVLKAWANPLLDLLVEGSAARSDEAMLEAVAPAADIERNLAAHVLPLVASLYERFGITGLSLNRVQAEVERLQKSHITRHDR